MSMCLCCLYVCTYVLSSATPQFGGQTREQMTENNKRAQTEIGDKETTISLPKAPLLCKHFSSVKHRYIQAIWAHAHHSTNS